MCSTYPASKCRKNKIRISDHSNIIKNLINRLEVIIQPPYYFKTHTVQVDRVYEYSRFKKLRFKFQRHYFAFWAQ